MALDKSRWILRKALTALLIACSWFGTSTSQAESTALDAPRPTMRIVFEEIKDLIPLSLDEDRWSEPSSRAKVLASLERLERAASALERHGRPREAGFNELALNLGGDLREARNRYALGAYEESRFFLTGSLQSCISCHVRLPASQSFPFADELMGKAQIDSLTPRERAWLLVTVRQFDDALSAWENLMMDPEISASQLDASGVLVDYLNVAIRVRGDIPRVSKQLDLFLARPDLPFYLKRRVQEWRAALASRDPRKYEPKSKPSLELGIALANEAGLVSEGPYGRDGFIQDLAAASHLVRWIEQDRAGAVAVTRNRTAEERRETALAYYWLGVVETRSLDGFWVNLSERHLEAAIRADPLGPVAQKAYALLEETQVLGFGGASGEYLPTDVWNLLKELRELMGVE